MKTIKFNDRGKDVLYLQELLQKHGSSVTSSETFDLKTQQEIMLFQEQHQLANDGIVGYQTWETLLFTDKDIKSPISNEDYKKIAFLLDIESATIRAIEEVETGGNGGFVAPGIPKTLFEGHIFWHQLSKRGIDPEQHVQGNEDILYPAWVKTFYQKGVKEYERLERARQINEEAANASTSWGKFQIMGFNHAACGIKSLEEFVAKMYRSELDQLLLFSKFIYRQKNASCPDDPEKYMISALRVKDWEHFACMYNGPLYAQNNYDTRLQNAYNKYSDK